MRARALPQDPHLPPGSDSDLLADDKASVWWGETASGEGRIEAKPEVKTRLGRSHTVSDSVVCGVLPVKSDDDWEPLVN